MTPVPRLDLAPKLKRRLYLWNPLDYLRLLYWVFFFPQALRWYVNEFGGGYIPEGEMNWQKGWELLRENAIQRQLLFQGLVLTVVTPVAIGLIFQTANVRINWFGVAFGVAGGVAFGVAGGVEFGVARGVAGSVALCVAGSVAGSVAVGVAGGVARGVAVGVAVGVAGGVARGVVRGVAGSVEFDVAGGVARGVSVGVEFGVAGGVAGGVAFGVAGGVAVGVAGGVAFGVAVLRPETWLIGSPLNLRTIQNSNWLLPRITPLPLPNLVWRLENWLQNDWETGLHNINELLAYTLQFIPVIQAVNRVLAKIPSDQLVWTVSRLAANPFDWDIVRFTSASLNETLKSRFIKDFFSFPLFFFFPHSWREGLQARLNTDTRLNTPARAAAAGFWHLHEKESARAIEAFTVVRSLLYGEEMYTLAQTLTTFQKAQKPASIAAIQVPPFPQEPLLHPVTWKILANLRRVVEDVQFVNRSVSRSARSLALNRALGELTKILNQANTLPQAERGLIIDIAETWQESLLQIAGEVGEISITKPVVNPYVVGDPVQGHLFVGREDIIRQLEELWVMGNQLQSVVLYGHRRMGKTSILVNAANCLGSQIQLAYVNLLRLGDSPQGVGEVLMAICDEISQTVKLSPPADADLLNLPYRTFERYLKQVEAQLDGGLIIALDEFEKIEDLIEANKIPIEFMGFLRGLVQMSSKIAFAFAGLHTLEEMTADYFQPFFASVIPIHVSFQERAATRQILANPDNEDFPLDYIPEALDEIYALTHGQPYLVQLLGFQLVRGYNDFVFEQGRSRDPVFTIEDVEAVINDPEFFKRGRYYFDGVWGQAARGAEGQQAIVRVLAPYPEGLSLDALAQSTGMNDADLQEALNTLKRHDVVEETQGSWRIMVELFRRWVLQFCSK
ncbi:ATP-binding protein [Nostoc sp. ATCC 53789]|uniref:AAA family ATPase n=1 Tax=Nostoc sp. ATCC 53789 TaxID=76335 RepID=UPI00132F4AA0|nr:ATP-binding protein [Nostoc sp. ATCC 53789]QHG18486.1 ATP-binding protein [Nostoc sp. ATCC 53789]